MALFLSPKEVAERWNCSARHVRRLCANGQLPAMRLLGSASWRIREDVAEAYEAGNTTPAKIATTPKVAMRHEKSQAGSTVFDLPDGYVPRFPELWNR